MRAISSFVIFAVTMYEFFNIAINKCINWRFVHLQYPAVKNQNLAIFPIIQILTCMHA